MSSVPDCNIVEVMPDERSSELIRRLLAVWEGSARATHAFLSEDDISEIREYVPGALRQVERLFIAQDDVGCPLAFMEVEADRLEMLFVEADMRSVGLGGRLLKIGVGDLGVRELTVNEQNPQSVGFYEHFGFEMYRRTDTDEQGRPFPLLYMRLANSTGKG